MTFAIQSIGTKSAVQQITITNSGSSALGINGVTVTGQNPGDFIQSNNCPPSLSAGGTCIVNVAFQPTATGARSASINISDNAPSSPQTVSVTGTGTQAAVSLSPSGPINFSSQAAGTQSAPVSVTVTDSGTGSLSFTKISFTGANSVDFTETDTCNASVPPSGICTIKVVFQPQCGNSQTARSATLVLTDNASNSPQNISLSGTATGDICFAAASGGSTSATVSPGSSATYSLDVSAANSYSGNVTLTCSDPAPESACSVNKTSVSVAGSTLVPFMITVTTTAPSAVGRQAPNVRIRRQPGSILAWASAFACFTIFVLLSLRRGWPALIRCRSVALALLFCVIGFVAVGCGGGDPGVVRTDPGTPAGTYTITVSGKASDNSSQSIQLTVVVD